MHTRSTLMAAGGEEGGGGIGNDKLVMTKMQYFVSRMCHLAKGVR